MKKLFLLLLFFIVVLYSCGPKIPSESPEGIFNKANGYMSKKEYSLAIELYYKLMEEYPGFKKYRPDVIYRLGVSLYETERYDEAEKIFLYLINKYKKYNRIKNAYILLFQIYTQILKDESKALQLINFYKKEFGEDETWENMNKTLSLLKTGTKDLSILRLKEKDITILSDTIVDKFEKEFFPVLSYESKKRLSNNKKMIAERKKTKEGYYLFLKDIVKNKGIKIPGSKNGYAPQWSWDDRYIIFTSMDWYSEERKIKIYNLNKNKTYMIFKGKNIESILCFSPDSSKIIFGYMGKFWIINNNGSNVSLLHKDIKSNSLQIMAWSRDGDKVLVKKINENKYHILQLGQREITLFK